MAYGLTRVVAMLGFLYAQGKSPNWPVEWHHDQLTWWGLMTSAWDGRWYSAIIDDGYPRALPEDALGNVEQNPWAFYPLFPMAARVLSDVSGIPGRDAGVLVAMLAGFGTVWCLRVLLTTLDRTIAVDRPWALFGAPLVAAAFPSAGIFSANYSDSLALLILCLTLLSLVKRRYGMFCVLILLLGLARPLAVPMGLAVLAHVGPALVQRWRSSRTVDWRSLRILAGLGAVSVASALVWPAVAAVTTGRRDALFVTQASWPRVDGASTSAPFSVWFSQWGDPVLATISLVGFTVWFVAVFRAERLRALGPELFAWSVGYVVFLMATVGIGASSLRYCLPALSLHLAAMLWATKWWHVASVLGTMLALQWIWVSLTFSTLFTP